MTNNELSRKVLKILTEKSGSVRFKRLVETLGADARTVFKNLFWLEEKKYVRLSTSYPSDAAVYPLIHLVHLRQAGEQLVNDKEQLDAVFPLSDTTSDAKPHIPPDMNQTALPTYSLALEMLAGSVRKNLQGEEKDRVLEKIESLLQLPFINQTISK